MKQLALLHPHWLLTPREPLTASPEHAPAEKHHYVNPTKQLIQLKGEKLRETRVITVKPSLGTFPETVTTSKPTSFCHLNAEL